MNTEIIHIGDAAVEVRRKRIKNMHIGVYPPEGRVRVAAPEAVSLDAIRVAVLTRMPWIRRRQAQFANQERQSQREYVSGETHYVFGRPFRLSVREWDRRTHLINVEGADRLILTTPRNAAFETRRNWMLKWHRKRLRETAGPKIAAWSDRLNVTPESWGIKAMKTKWGSCNPERGSIWINAELSRKPPEAIDFVILHELTHLISPHHDETFLAVLDREMPTWRQVRSDLNALPLAAWVD